MKWLLTISAVFYLLTFILEGNVAEPVVIALYAGAMILSGYTTFLRGLRNLTRFKFNMDTLMTVALIGAVIIGEWREATLVAILFGLNELLEGYGMNRARNRWRRCWPRHRRKPSCGKTVRPSWYRSQASLGDVVG